MLGLRLLRLLACLLVLAVGSPVAAAAAPGSEDEVLTLRVDLVTIGPGDPFLTRAGHTALVITEQDEDGRQWGRTYNFGDTNFSDASIPFRFLFGSLDFYLSETGDLFDTTVRYGLEQDRDVVRQPLALSQAQARVLSQRLQALMQPGERDYAYHYLEQTCSTKVRDLLDEVTDGALRAQLSDPDPWTIRDYQQLTFDGDIAVALLGDTLFGRLHDRPIDRYYALLWPERMSQYLAEVQVPDPAGGDALVPLAGPVEVLAERDGEPRTQERNPITWYVAAALALWALLGAAWLAARGRARPRLAALWLCSWSLPSGVLGLLMVIFQLASSVPELRSNELMASLLFTDLALVAVALRWWRKGTEIPRWLPRYASARLAIVAVAAGLRAAGVFIQQPWMIPVASLACAAGLWWLVRAWRGSPPPRPPS